MAVFRQPLKDFALWQVPETGLSPMLAVNLEITDRCNNRCRHCYINLRADDVKAKSEEIRLEEIIRIADEAASLGVLWLLISGGEPLLREDFPEIYLHLKKMGFLVSVFTNATLVTGDHARLFKSYPPRQLEVSVYGVTRETYDRVVRRKGAFAEFSRGLDLLERAGVAVTLKTMAIRSNYGELLAIAEFCETKSRNSFRFDPLLHLRYDRNEDRNREIRDERLTAEEIVGLEKMFPDRVRAIENICGSAEQTETGVKCDSTLFLCGAGIGECTVDANANVRLCSSLRHPDCAYSLRTGNLAEALKTVIPKVRSIRSNRNRFLHTCKICRLVDLCHWCPAHAYLETGDMDASVEYFCEVAHARAKSISSHTK